MKHLILFLTLALGLVAAAPAANAQLQQSGGAGSTVSVTQGGNTAAVDASGRLSTGLNAVGGTAITLGQKAMTASLPVTIASDQGNLGVTVASGSVGLNAGTNLIGKVALSTTCGSTFVDSGITKDLPATTTLATNMSLSTCVEKVFFSNTTGSALSVNLTDNAGTPNSYMTTFSLPANSNMLLDFGGIKFLSGVKWSASSATGVNAQVVGYQ